MWRIDHGREEGRVETWDQCRQLLPDARQEMIAVRNGMETVEMEKVNLYKVYCGVRPDRIIGYEGRGKWRGKDFWFW